jgi:hypothetical protein
VNIGPQMIDHAIHHRGGPVFFRALAGAIVSPALGVAKGRRGRAGEVGRQRSATGVNTALRTPPSAFRPRSPADFRLVAPASPHVIEVNRIIAFPLHTPTK